MSRVAPVVRFALAWTAGLAVGLVDARWAGAFLLALPALRAPIGASPVPRLPLAPLLLLAGILAGVVARGADSGCPSPEDGAPARIHGRFLVTPRSGSAPFETVGGCGVVTVVLPRGADHVATSGAFASAGRPLLVSGRWRAGRLRPWVAARSVAPVPTGEESVADEGLLEGLRWWSVAWRDRLVGRLTDLFPERGGLVAALVLARREGLDPEIRDAFAVAGIAHLLAISGFHVGLVAGLFFAGVRAGGAKRRHAAAWSALLAWAYVGFIGFPDAACRAALILSLAAAGRARGVPSTRWAPLAAAALLLLAGDPRRLLSPGFQLSFAGAGGLVAWAGPVGRAMDGWYRARLGSAPPAWLVSPVASGAAATLATLPLVAWHFQRVSLVGIPVTLVATPLVSLALPGALATLALDVWAPTPARFLAGGVDVLLAALVKVTEVAAAPPWASAWVERPTVVAALLGTGLAAGVARAPGIGARGRRRITAVWICSAVVAWPLVSSLEGAGRLEIVMMDVGQGDALGIRTPAGRWIVVDAGPPVDGDPRAHPVVRSLRARGVRRIEMLLFTHPDLDHFGGGPALLDAFDVGRIADPLLPAPKSSYAELIAHARDGGVPWTGVKAGDAFEVDGVRLRVFHPEGAGSSSGGKITGGAPPPESDANAVSVVLLVSWRGFDALLTGDAYVDVERRIAPLVGDVDLLKVGHHGSRTSTDPDFLEEVRPELALLSVGRRNRYGHPAPDVLRRLEGAGAEIRRTDLEGTVRVLVEQDGRIRVEAERPRGLP